jgi:hypothetical protein
MAAVETAREGDRGFPVCRGGSRVANPGEEATVDLNPAHPGHSSAAYIEREPRFPADSTPAEGLALD